MAIASKEEVLELYTRVIRGEEVDNATIQAAKALARHYGIDAPGNDPDYDSGTVIIIDDIPDTPPKATPEEAQEAVKEAAQEAAFLDGFEQN